MIQRRKVYAYIVQGRDIVVFEQPRSPEAGIQVPGGTVEPGEMLDAAVLREAFEETGLRGLSIANYLGQRLRDLRPEGINQVHERHFYHLTCSAAIPQRWQHAEQYPSEGPPVPIPFALYRASLDALPDICCDMTALIPDLRRILG